MVIAGSIVNIFRPVVDPEDMSPVLEKKVTNMVAEEAATLLNSYCLWMEILDKENC